MTMSVENMIRQQLESMGIKPHDDEDEQQQETPQQEAPSRVSVEAVLSAAIGDRPVVGPAALNADRRLAAIIGADTLEGKPL